MPSHLTQYRVVLPIHLTPNTSYNTCTTSILGQVVFQGFDEIFWRLKSGHWRKLNHLKIAGINSKIKENGFEQTAAKMKRQPNARSLKCSSKNKTASSCSTRYRVVFLARGVLCSLVLLRVNSRTSMPVGLWLHSFCFINISLPATKGGRVSLPSKTSFSSSRLTSSLLESHRKLLFVILGFRLANI